MKQKKALKALSKLFRTLTQKSLALAMVMLILGLQITPSVLQWHSALAQEAELAIVEPDPLAACTATKLEATGYYSPKPNQSKYVKNYDWDIVMNGRGTNYASGKEVYYGGAAGPKSMPFGTLVVVDGVGTFRIEDRGGRIQDPEAGHPYARFDIWFGPDVAGLDRALNWGRRTVNATICPAGTPGLEVGVDFPHEEYNHWEWVAEAIVENALGPQEISANIGYGMQGENVSKLQTRLKEWELFDGNVDGFYGESTRDAVGLFQEMFALAGPTHLAYGYTGPQTRRTVDAVINGELSIELDALEILEGKDLVPQFSRFTYDNDSISELGLGSSGPGVTKLQGLLKELGYYGLEPTSYYDEITENAVYRFQLAQGIVSSKSDQGWGHTGPKTSAAINSILDERDKTMALLAYNRQALNEGRKIVGTPELEVALVEEEE